MNMTSAIGSLSCCLITWAGGALAQSPSPRLHPPPPQPSVERGVQQYRDMMRADPWANPGNLDVDRGAALWTTPRGRRRVALTGCDLGRGKGILDGAFAELPRYFADAGRVQDLEARLIWCMQMLQGFTPAELMTQPHPLAGQPTTDLGALATFVASKSNGLRFAVQSDHPQERRAMALGEALFKRRQGPLDFSCATCHSAPGKRIRLQELAQLTAPAAAHEVIGQWPAYRVSSAHTMTMQHRIYDCYGQMRLPEVQIGSDVTVALITYLSRQAVGGEISVPGLKR